MSPERGKQAAWVAAIGVGAGVAAVGLVFWRRRARRARYETAAWRPARPRGAAEEVAVALRRDPRVGRRGIEVDAITDGVIELRGTVQDRSEAERAMGIAQATTGVYTVVNRLRTDSEESRRESNRRRWSEGAPELRVSQHYGMGVGMGTRRQSPDTDPDRPSDKQKRLDRELDVANVEDAPESGPDPISGAEAVDDIYTKPGDERAIEEAGLDPSPRPTSTPRRSVEGDEGAGGAEGAGGREEGA